MAASASRAPAGIFEGPAPKRPSAGLISSGITMSVTVPILSAMVEIPGWRVERLPITHPDAALLVEEVQAEYVVRYGGRDETPIEPAYFEEPMGAFFVGYLHDRPVVDRSLAPTHRRRARRAPATAEIKRMYVAPTARRLGPGAGDAGPPRGDGAGGRGRGDGARDRDPPARGDHALRVGRLHPVAGFGFYKDSPMSRCFARSLLLPAVRAAELLSRRRLPDQPVSSIPVAGTAGAPRSCCAACRAVPRSRRPPTAGRPNGRSARGIGR